VTRFGGSGGSGGFGGSGGSHDNQIGEHDIRNACAREVTRRGHQVVKFGKIHGSSNEYRMDVRVRQGSSGPERVIGCNVNRSTGAASIRW